MSNRALETSGLTKVYGEGRTAVTAVSGADISSRTTSSLPYSARRGRERRH